MSTQKSLFNIFDTQKRKPESDTDLGDDTWGKKHKFYLQSWKFVSMHMAVNLNHCKVLCMEQIISSAQVWHDISLVMTTQIIAINIIKQRRSHETVAHHVQEKVSTALKAQVRTAFVMGKEEIPDWKFNAQIDFQVS